MFNGVAASRSRIGFLQEPGVSKGYSKGFYDLLVRTGFCRVGFHHVLQAVISGLQN